MSWAICVGVVDHQCTCHCAGARARYKCNARHLQPGTEAAHCKGWMHGQKNNEQGQVQLHSQWCQLAFQGLMRPRNNAPGYLTRCVCSLKLLAMTPYMKLPPMPPKPLQQVVVHGITSCKDSSRGLDNLYGWNIWSHCKEFWRAHTSCQAQPFPNVTSGAAASSCQNTVSESHLLRSTLQSQCHS